VINAKTLLPRVVLFVVLAGAIVWAWRHRSPFDSARLQQ